tara:strand:- start:1477 stop:1650 length:174 start_codon:yes stop_codon:yes gene_type:complete
MLQTHLYLAEKVVEKVTVKMEMEVDLVDTVERARVAEEEAETVVEQVVPVVQPNMFL